MAEPMEGGVGTTWQPCAAAQGPEPVVDLGGGDGCIRRLERGPREEVPGAAGVRGRILPLHVATEFQLDVRIHDEPAPDAALLDGRTDVPGHQPRKDQHVQQPQGAQCGVAQAHVLQQEQQQAITVVAHVVQQQAALGVGVRAQVSLWDRKDCISTAL